MNLFDKNNKWSDTANSMNSKVRNALTPIIQEWFEDGYDPRHLSYIIQDGANEACLDQMLDLTKDKDNV
jgi:hypothetical protein